MINGEINYFDQEFVNRTFVNLHYVQWLENFSLLHAMVLLWLITTIFGVFFHHEGTIFLGRIMICRGRNFAHYSFPILIIVTVYVHVLITFFK
jgi:hypothetical protein